MEITISIPVFPTLDLSAKFTYLIGNNGVGKSRMLEHNAKKISFRQDVVVIASGLTDKFRFGRTVRKEKQGSYTYLGNRTVGNASHITTLSANAVLHYVESLKRGTSSILSDFLIRLGFDPIVYVTPRTTKKIRAEDAGFNRSVLDDTFVEQHSKVLANPVKPFSLSISKRDEQINFIDLSSGEQNIISTALKIISNLREGVIFFVDEPEISLHLEWQLAWPSLVHRIISSINNCRMIVATHSPVLISSAMAVGANCFNMEQGSGLRVITREDINVEMLMLKEFHTYTPKNKALFEEFARILSMAIDHVNDSAYTKSSIKAELGELKKRIQDLSTSDADSLGVTGAAEEFEGAVLEILNRNGNHA
ncbi:AAA family ATPase [Pseudomonas bijieensis]|uniref:ATP-binding protein n=1 Tax=Pseudomonas bijieensis TaxID=2681983 RepID=A0A6N1CGX7_9PSED|nr:AAA family ATPase [Pseudomonas bijieensis]QKS83712.1 ATP-binding protein [Pseudomonas bijieensis]